MTKIFVSICSFLFAANALASGEYVGLWCQRYDDFTEVLQVDAKDQVIAYTMGNQAGEKSPIRRGYVSQGASGFQMVIDNMDYGVVDYKVRKAFLSDRRVLILKMSDGEKEKFRECSKK